MFSTLFRIVVKFNIMMISIFIIELNIRAIITYLITFRVSRGRGN